MDDPGNNGANRGFDSGNCNLLWHGDLADIGRQDDFLTGAQLGLWMGEAGSRLVRSLQTPGPRAERCGVLASGPFHKPESRPALSGRLSANELTCPRLFGQDHLPAEPLSLCCQ